MLASKKLFKIAAPIHEESMSKVHFANIENLKWAREKSCLDFPAIYKKTSWKNNTKKIEKWEAGEEIPTVDELRKLGKVYQKPWTIFIMKQNVKDLKFTILQDFRSSLSRESIESMPLVVEFLK